MLDKYKSPNFPGIASCDGAFLGSGAACRRRSQKGNETGDSPIQSTVHKKLWAEIQGGNRRPWFPLEMRPCEKWTKKYQARRRLPSFPHSVTWAGGIPQKFMVLGRNLEWETNVSNSCLSVGGVDRYAPLYGPEANDLVWICGTERTRRQTGRIL